MLQAKIVNDPEVRDGKWGKYILIKTKVLKTGEDIAIFGKLNDEVANSKTRGEIITIAKNGNGKYKIVAPIENKRSSQGLTPVKEIIEDYVNDDLGLPGLLTDRQKKNLHNLAVERARLLTHCIEIMTKEMDAKGLEVYESSVKSLGVSLFIHLNKYLP